MVSVTSAARPVSLPLLGALLGASLILGACNLSAATPQGEDSSGGGAYATSQGALEGAGGGKGGKGLGNCTEYPWMLTAVDVFDMTVAGTKVHIEASGQVPLTVDNKGGSVTSSGPAGVGVLTGSNKDGCQMIASWDYSATVSGTCFGGMMTLDIVEVYGEGGMISGTMTCPDEKPKPFVLPWAAMTHPQRSFLLSPRPNSGPASEPDTIPWGIGGTGSKVFTVKEHSPLVPLQ